MKKNKVCHISTVHSVFDDRIFFKECISLAQNKFDVNFIAPHEKDELINGVNIISIPKYENRFKRFFISGFKAFFKALKTKASICHFHDPELLWLGIALRIFGRKVIYDVHENYTQQILYKEWISFYAIRKLVSITFFILEKISCLFFNKIITVTEDIKSRFPKNKTYLIRNFPIIPDFSNVKIIERPLNKTILIYAGGLTEVRGIKELIKSLEFTSDDIELWLIGNFDNENYFNECKNISSWNKVNYLGYKRHDEVFSYINSADIGISLLYPIKNYLTSLPVKVFEYMVVGKPVIMSNFPYWESYFKDCAIFTNPLDPQEIAMKINELSKNNLQRKTMGENGYSKIMSEYSWDKEKLNLISIYNTLL